MITKVGLLNFKGLNREIPLGPITVIRGGNMVGKTAVLSAVRIGLLGFDPDLGKQHVATQDAMSGKVMGVTLTFASGARFEHGWDSKGYTVTPNSFTPAPLEMLSLDEFFKITSKERAKYLISKCPTAPVNVDDFRSLLVRELISEGVQNTDAVLKPLVEFWQPLDQRDAAKWMDLVATKSAAELTFNKRRLEEHRAAAASLAAQAIDETPREIVQDQSAEIAKVTTERLKVHGNQLNATKVLAEAKAAVARITADGKRVYQDIVALKKELLEPPKCSRCGVVIVCECQKDAAAKVEIKIASKDKLQTKLISDLKTANLRVEVEAGVANQAAVDLAAIDEKLNGLRVLQAKWEQERGRRSVTAEQSVKGDEYENAILGYKVIVKVIAEENVKRIERSITPLLDTANLIIKPVINTTLKYEDGEFTFMRSGNVVRMKVMSGTERLAVFAGLQFALSAGSTPKILIVDELGRMTDGSLGRFLKAISDQIAAGTLTQFIGAIPLGPEVFADYVSVVDIKRQP